MKSREYLRRGKAFVCNDPYLAPQEMEKLMGPLLLHVSDTPIQLLSYIKKVIKKFNPQYIVHTGDIIDNIKLEIECNRYHEYERMLVKMLEMLESTAQGEIYLAAGNHDDLCLMEKHSKRAKVISQGEIQVEGYTFYINHYFQEPLPPSDYYLYGHSFTPAHYQQGRQRGLNGVLNMNLIILSTGEVVHLNYPIETNRLRRMERRKVGL